VIPGKKYKPEDFLEMAWRRRWFILLPLLATAVGTFIWAQSLPNVYRSEATVLIIPAQVPTNLVKSTITDTLQKRLNLVKEQILSRARLEQMIEEFDLYKADRKRLLMEQIVEQMRKDANVTVPKTGRKQVPGYFVVSFDSEDPQKAMLVAERLASLFVKENLVNRNNQTDATSQFLQSQVDEALRRLKEHDAKLETFKRANAGRLPDEVKTNLQMIENARQDIQSEIDGINRDKDRQLTLERNIADEMALGPIANQKPGQKGSTSGQSAAQELEAAKAALATLQLRLKPEHPDVRMAKANIAELEKKVAAEALQQPVSEGAPTTALSSADAQRALRVSKLKTEVESLGRDITVRQAKVQKAQAAIADYQSRVQQAPLLESRLAELMRDYTSLKSTYEGLTKKAEDAKLSANIEQRQVGEQFRIGDPATRPERPKSPDRLRLNLVGSLLGLCLGLAIAALLEYRDTSLRSEDDVLVALTLPVVAMVPKLWTDTEIRKVRQRRLLVASCVAVTFMVSAAALVWKLRLLSSWGL
jgi:polysaccharide chain length determinant protein (PEP-CTERM system associated)